MGGETIKEVVRLTTQVIYQVFPEYILYEFLAYLFGVVLRN